MKGWEVKTLGTVVRLEYGKPLPQEDRDPDGSHPAYGANGILCRTNKYYHDRPSFIVGRKGSAGEINLTAPKFWPLDVTYFVTFDEQKYDLMFLYHVFDFLDLPSLAKGVKPGINRNDVYALSFAFPPLDEQRRIVAILDEAFAGLAVMRQHAEANVKNARALFDSHLNAIFSQRGEGWIEIQLSQVAKVQSGAGFPEKLQGSKSGDFPFYKVSDMNLPGNETRMTIANNFISEAVRQKLGARIFPAGSVIFPKVGGAIATNKKRLISKPACVDNNVMGIIPNENKLSSRYLDQIMKHKDIYEFSNKAALPSIRQSTVEEWKINIPMSLQQQVSVAEALEEYSVRAGELQKIYRRKLAAIDELKQSILHRAFSGELSAKDALAA